MQLEATEQQLAAAQLETTQFQELHQHEMERMRSLKIRQYDLGLLLVLKYRSSGNFRR